MINRKENTMALYLDYENAKACVDKIKPIIERMEEAAADINSVMTSELGQYWDGNAYLKTIETYEDSYKQMLTEKLPQMVEDLRKFMDDCVTTLKDVDNQISGKP